MPANSRRDEFPIRIRRQIARKSGYRCSNPACRRMLIGPSEDFRKVVFLGIVSHICAAAPGGPRYDPEMTPEERSGEENGLLLCRYCAALVDADDRAYPAHLLRVWKRQACQFALEQLSARQTARGTASAGLWFRSWSACASAASKPRDGCRGMPGSGAMRGSCTGFSSRSCPGRAVTTDSCGSGAMPLKKFPPMRWNLRRSACRPITEASRGGIGI